jgi:ethanolamine utilization microcompartment shell protein EutL
MFVAGRHKGGIHVTPQKTNSLLIAVLSLVCLTTAISAWQGYANHQTHKAARAILKESVYTREAVQASTQLQMLRFLEAKESASAQQLSESLLRSAELALADYSPPASGTEASKTIVAVKQNIAKYRSR